MSALPPKADINARVLPDAHHGRPQHQQRSTAMQVHEYSSPPAPICTPWNKGKLIGAKPPLWPKHVWSIRTKLHIEGRILELALFNLAIDSKLRACDVVTLKVEDVAPNGDAVARATVRQKKTRRQVRIDRPHARSR